VTGPVPAETAAPQPSGSNGSRPLRDVYAAALDAAKAELVAIRAQRRRLDAREAMLTAVVAPLQVLLRARPGDRLLGTADVIRAYALTLTPGDDGTARIDIGALEDFADAVLWVSPATDRRLALMQALSHLAGAGRLERRGPSDYWTVPPDAPPLQAAVIARARNGQPG
jgi:hypothetical protein